VPWITARRARTPVAQMTRLVERGDRDRDYEFWRVVIRRT
jgi:hypothetical protein